MTKKIGLIIPPKNADQKIQSGGGILSCAERDLFIEKVEKENFSQVVTELYVEQFYVKNGLVYQGDLCVSELDAVFWFYCVCPMNDSWDLLMLKTLAQTTNVLPNPHNVEIGLDKFQSHTLLRNAGLPTADFSLFRSNQVHDVVKNIKDFENILLKPTKGSFGQGIHKINSEREFIDAVQYAESFSNKPLEIFCEKFEKNDLNNWIGTTIINSELIYGYRKRLEKFSEWKVYDAHNQGGGIDYVDPAPVADLALKAASVLGCDIIGFDFIYSAKQQRYIIVDENTLPGLYESCFNKSNQRPWNDLFIQLIKKNLNISMLKEASF